MESLPGYDAWKLASPDTTYLEDEPEEERGYVIVRKSGDVIWYYTRDGEWSQHQHEAEVMEDCPDEVFPGEEVWDLDDLRGVSS